MVSKFRSNMGTVLLGSVLSASLFLNYVQAVKLRAVGGAAGAESGPGPNAGKRLIGQKLSPIDAVRMSGERVRLEFTSSPTTVVYLMSPNCGWCIKNYDNIVALARSVVGGRIIGLARGRDPLPVQIHLLKKPLPFDVYVVDAEDWLEQYKLIATPTTLVTNESGVVTQAWVGAFSGEAEKEIEAFFKVRLPGLAK
jgi:hypothetical protein